MSDAVVGTKPADQIDVTLFREVMLFPFAIEPSDDRELEISGAARVEAIEAALATSDHWRRVDDLLRHLPEDRAPEPDDITRRARMLAPAYEEFVYFQPYVQRFLYGGTRGGGLPEPILLFAREDIAALELEFAWRGDNAKRRRFSFAIERCNLYLFETGNALLALEFAFDRLEAGFPGDSGEEAVAAKRFTLADAQMLIECVRRVFPPFFTIEGWRHDDPEAGLEPYLYADRVAWIKKGDAPRWEKAVSVDPAEMIEHVLGAKGAAKRHRSPPIFEPWRELLAPLTVEGSGIEAMAPAMTLHQTGDDRAFVMAQIGVADMLEIERSDWVRLCFADAPEPNGAYPYAKAFLENFEQENCYDRFFEPVPESWQKTRTMACGYTFLMVGNCGAMSADPNGFFRNVIGKHFRRHYFQLVLISLFQKTALLTLSERLASALDRLDPDDASDTPIFHREVQGLQKEVMRFTHRYWFEDISAQIQAQELFDLLRRQLRTRPLYDQLLTEISESHKHMELERQGRLGETARNLNKAVAVGLVLATIAGFFGMNVLVPDKSHWGLQLASLLAVSLGALALFTYARSKKSDLFDWLLDSWRRFSNRG